MFGKKRSGLIGIFLLLILVLLVCTLNQPLSAKNFAEPQETVITVNSGADPDDSKSKTCLSDVPCTLRRAIVQARELPEEDRPVTITFNIPTSDDSYDALLEVWVLQIMSTSDPSVFRRLEGGQITIDGQTQPNGRPDGPKIILRGPGKGTKDGLLIGVNNSGDHDGNVLRGLAFQNFKTHMTLNSNSNLVEQNWFGLTADGLAVYLRDGEPQDGSGSAGVALSANVTGNIVSNNVFLGLDGVAATLRGDGNTFQGNYVGTNFLGTVPDKAKDPDLICTKVDWLGGGGLNLDGEGHFVEDNIIAGLRQEIFSGSTQPPAVELSGADHIVRNNQIGLDMEGHDIGVCGRGVYLTSGPQMILVEGNAIVNPGMSGISLNGALYDGNTLRSNTIKSSKEWPQVAGNPEKEDAIQLGPSLPKALLTFSPAKIDSIDEKMVSGSTWPGSDCPNCIVELFLDDKDNIKEALQSLAVVTAGADGLWTAEIPFELNEDQALRTTSTTAKFNTIKGLDAGTTTGLSGLYVPQNPGVFMPFIIGG